MTSSDRTKAHRSLSDSDNRTDAQEVALALHEVAASIRSLGIGGVDAPGPLEFIGMALRDGIAELVHVIAERSE